LGVGGVASASALIETGVHVRRPRSSWSRSWWTSRPKSDAGRIKLLDVVVLTTDISQHNLHRGEIGAVVECYVEVLMMWNVWRRTATRMAS
jgi:hypothetical protein